MPLPQRSLSRHRIEDWYERRPVDWKGVHVAQRIRPIEEIPRTPSLSPVSGVRLAVSERTRVSQGRIGRGALLKRRIAATSPPYSWIMTGWGYTFSSLCDDPSIRTRIRFTKILLAHRKKSSDRLSV